MAKTRYRPLLPHGIDTPMLDRKNDAMLDCIFAVEYLIGRTAYHR
jgi:hypothetical protein